MAPGLAPAEPLDAKVQAPAQAPSEAQAEPTADTIGAAKKRIAPQAVVAQLMAAWPQAFFADPRAVKPLAIGTLQQILANRPAELEGFNSHAIRTGLKFYTSRLSYHYGIVHNTHRITLAGEPADEVDDKAREFAKTQIVAIQQQRAARRAAQNPPSDVLDAEPAPAGDEQKPRRRFHRAQPNREAVVPAEDSRVSVADAVTDAPRRASPESPRAASPSRSRAPRREQRGAQTAPIGDAPARAPRPQSAATTPAPLAQENLTLEEKLARLAQHFGKPS
jgi:ProP effector